MSGPQTLVQFLDDEPSVLDGLRRRLRQETLPYAVAFSTDPTDVLAQAQAGEIDVLVSDIRMPVLDGFELLARLRTTTSGTRLPVIFLTGQGDAAHKRRALELDATDVLNKPVELEELLARIRSALRLKSYADALANQNEQLEERVRERTASLERSQREIVWRLAKAGELRDEATGNHVMRVGWLCGALARAMGLPEKQARDLMLAAPLHDLGKIGVPDAILRKRGPLDPCERAVMEQHCEIGAALLRERPRLAGLMADGAGESELENPLLDSAACIALNHHERWDGQGYPRGLKALQIPLEARIAAVADVLDALCSPRPYKPAYSPDTAMLLISQQAGAHFDPDVVDALQQVLPRWRQVQAEFADEKVASTSEAIP